MSIAFSIAFVLLKVCFFSLSECTLVLKTSFITDGQADFSFANYIRILSRTYYQKAILNSFVVGIAATIGATILGVPLAFVLARLPIPGKSFVLVFSIPLPLVLPSFIRSLRTRTVARKSWVGHDLAARIRGTVHFDLRNARVDHGVRFYALSVHSKCPHWPPFARLMRRLEEAGSKSGEQLDPACSGRWRYRSQSRPFFREHYSVLIDDSLGKLWRCIRSRRRPTDALA